jgi:hypothetical protein
MSVIYALIALAFVGGVVMTAAIAEAHRWRKRDDKSNVIPIERRSKVVAEPARQLKRCLVRILRF